MIRTTDVILAVALLLAPTQGLTIPPARSSLEISRVGDGLIHQNLGGVQVKYKKEDYDRCFKAWQEDCEEHWEGDATSVERICHRELERPHIKSHMLVTAAQIRNMMRPMLAGHWAGNAMPRLFVPRYTNPGWKNIRPPADLHQRVADWYESQRFRMSAETWPSMVDVGCNNNYDNDDYLIPWDMAQPVLDMQEWIKKQLEEWMDTKVDTTWKIAYGARLQHEGSTCGMHVDMGSTHVMSATYNIAQKKVNKPWPLSFVEPGGHVTRAEQTPGDIILYEGASGMHGRPDPLDGQEFVSIYFHWRPHNWNERMRSQPYGRAFEELVEVNEPQPEEEELRLTDEPLANGNCPGRSSDATAASKVPELWRGAHTTAKRVFDPSGLSLAQIKERVGAFSSSAAEVQDFAAHVVHDLGLFDYVALHARDLTNDPGAVAPATVLARWVAYLQPGTKLYVAGDGAKAYAEKNLGDATGVTIFTKDSFAGLKSDKELAMEAVESIICASARIFIGSSDASGFTGSVQDLRTKADAPSTVPLRHQDTKSAPQDELDGERVGNAIKEWKQRHS